MRSYGVDGRSQEVIVRNAGNLNPLMDRAEDRRPLGVLC